ncbi:MAG TPA: hypothetical protein VF644_18010 [Pyrinomonadaceae bacterium]|jgi:hypothetical protein
MSLAKIQALLARLYTDAKLRERFLLEPEKVCAENDLIGSEIEQIAQILPEELNFFAESLFYKRLREVEKLLPRTKEILSEDFEKYFREFSNGFLPAAIKKHLEDAVQFADFLLKQELKSAWLKDLIRYEQANLSFNGFGKKFLLRRFNFNIKEISLNGVQAQRKPSVAVWLRIGGKTQHFVW